MGEAVADSEKAFNNQSPTSRAQAGFSNAHTPPKGLRPRRSRLEPSCHLPAPCQDSPGRDIRTALGMTQAMHRRRGQLPEGAGGPRPREAPVPITAERALSRDPQHGAVTSVSKGSTHRTAGVRATSQGACWILLLLDTAGTAFPCFSCFGCRKPLLMTAASLLNNCSRKSIRLSSWGLSTRTFSSL